MNKAVIYARFSCSKQREASIEDQIRVCREWCEREGYEVVAEYADRAISGKTDDRPEFQRMIANAGESDIVLVYMMDRFSRDAFDAPIYKRELAKKGVRLVSALESIPDSPEGIIYEKLLEGLAACESMKTSVRTMRGMKGNALKCMVNGPALYGYRKGPDSTYEVDPEQAANVREMFRLRIDGHSTNSIAATMRKRGVRSVRGRPCSYSMVKSILGNEKYTGVYTWGDVRIEGGMPQIVDREDFIMAQRIIPTKRRENEDWTDYPLVGKAYCMSCGRPLRGVSGHGKSGKKYEYYACGDKCMRNIRRETLEDLITDGVREILSNPDETREIASRIVEVIKSRNDRDDVVGAARRALRESEDGLRNLYAAIEKGLDFDAVSGRISELEEQRDNATMVIASSKAGIPTVDEMAEFLSDCKEMPDDVISSAFLYRVEVSDDYIVAALNYRVKENEHATLEFERVRTNDVWQPVGHDSRTQITMIDGFLLVRIDRAA